MGCGVFHNIKFINFINDAPSDTLGYRAVQRHLVLAKSNIV